jgi:hypothetical protein
MKFFKFFVVLNFLTLAVLAGGSLSNGPTGYQYLDCTGKSNKNAVSLAVKVIMGKGIVLSYAEEGKATHYNLVTVEENTSGVSIFKGTPMSVVVPKNQVPNPNNTFVANLYVDQKLANTLVCTRF